MAIKLIRPGAGTDDLEGGAKASGSCARPRRWRGCRTPTWSSSTMSAASTVTCSSRWSTCAARSLRRWLTAGARSWRTILDAFLAAGRGLAAAHGAGIVHRDFKPDNVLVRDDGRVQVTDFGVARGAGEVEPVKAGRRTSHGLLGVSVTVTGDLVGTPLYMAPEQHRREPTDARADQFSFCVALFEALCGTHPFGDAVSSGFL